MVVLEVSQNLCLAAYSNTVSFLRICGILLRYAAIDLERRALAYRLGRLLDRRTARDLADEYMLYARGGVVFPLYITRRYVVKSHIASVDDASTIAEEIYKSMVRIRKLDWLKSSLRKDEGPLIVGDEA